MPHFACQHVCSTCSIDNKPYAAACQRDHPQLAPQLWGCDPRTSTGQTNTHDDDEDNNICDILAESVASEHADATQMALPTSV